MWDTSEYHSLVIMMPPGAHLPLFYFIFNYLKFNLICIFICKDLLQDEAAAVAGAQLLRDECTSGENCDTASQPDRIATKTSATAACSKHSTPGASGKRLRQEAKMARKARRAEEQRQKVQRPPPTKTEHPGGSSICI